MKIYLHLEVIFTISKIYSVEFEFQYNGVAGGCVLKGSAREHLTFPRISVLAADLHAMINVIFYHAASVINLEQSHNQFSRDRGYSAAVSMLNSEWLCSLCTTCL